MLCWLNGMFNGTSVLFCNFAGFKNLQNPRKQLVQMILGKEVPRQPWLEGLGTDGASAGADPLHLSCDCFPLKSRSGSKKNQTEMFSA